MPYKELPIGLFTGRSNPALAEGIARAYGQDLGHLTIKNVADVEVYVRYEESIRAEDVFIINSTQPHA